MGKEKGNSFTLHTSQVDALLLKNNKVMKLLQVTTENKANSQNIILSFNFKNDIDCKSCKHNNRINLFYYPFS